MKQEPDEDASTAPPSSSRPTESSASTRVTRGAKAGVKTEPKAESGRHEEDEVASEKQFSKRRWAVYGQPEGKVTKVFVCVRCKRKSDARSLMCRCKCRT